MDDLFRPWFLDEGGAGTIGGSRFWEDCRLTLELEMLSRGGFPRLWGVRELLLGLIVLLNLASSTNLMLDFRNKGPYVLQNFAESISMCPSPLLVIGLSSPVCTSASACLLDISSENVFLSLSHPVISRFSALLHTYLNSSNMSSTCLSSFLSSAIASLSIVCSKRELYYYYCWGGGGVIYLWGEGTRFAEDLDWVGVLVIFRLLIIVGGAVLMVILDKDSFCWFIETRALFISLFVRWKGIVTSVSKLERRAVVFILRTWFRIETFSVSRSMML